MPTRVAGHTQTSVSCLVYTHKLRFFFSITKLVFHIQNALSSIFHDLNYIHLSISMYIYNVTYLSFHFSLFNYTNKIKY